MALVWVSVIVVLIAIVLAILWVVSIRKRRLVSNLRVEIENQGNIDSRYQLLAEDPLGGLEFHFYRNGEPLQVLMKSNDKGIGSVAQNSAAVSPSRSSGDAGKVSNAIGFTGAVANVIIGFGSLLPASIGRPILQAGNQLFQSSSNASRAQTVSQQAAELGKGPRPTEYPRPYQAGSENVVQTGGVAWAETPSVKPGEKILVDLRIQATYFKSDFTRTIQLKSCASEGARSQVITADGQVRVRGGFLSHEHADSVEGNFRNAEKRSTGNHPT